MEVGDKMGVDFEGGGVIVRYEGSRNRETDERGSRNGGAVEERRSFSNGDFVAYVQ